MAEDTKNLQAAPNNPQGMNDNAPLERIPSWFRALGVNNVGQQYLQRCNGKVLINKFSAPILGITGDLRTRVFVETSEALYMFENISDTIPI